jgi:hypothetical protein
LDKLKQQNADCMGEVIAAANEKGQALNESRLLRERLKKA